MNELHAYYYVKDNMPLQELQALRRVEHKGGHMSDLISEVKSEWRLYLSRMRVEDGAPYNNQVIVELYNPVESVWEVFRKYEAKEE